MPKLRLAAFRGMRRELPPSALRPQARADEPPIALFEVHNLRADQLPLWLPRPVPRFPHEPSGVSTTFPYRQPSGV